LRALRQQAVGCVGLGQGQVVVDVQKRIQAGMGMGCLEGAGCQLAGADAAGAQCFA
jgi:hypothetical protein